MKERHSLKFARSIDKSSITSDRRELCYCARNVKQFRIVFPVHLERWQSATMMTSEETMELLSSVRLGVNIRLIEELPISVVNELFLHTQPRICKSLWVRLLTAKNEMPPEPVICGPGFVNWAHPN